MKKKISRPELQKTLDKFGLGAAAKTIASLVRPSIGVFRVPLDTKDWPKLFHDMEAQVRAHHKKHGLAEFESFRKVKPDRSSIVVPDGPLAYSGERDRSFRVNVTAAHAMVLRG